MHMHQPPITDWNGSLQSAIDNGCQNNNNVVSQMHCMFGDTLQSVGETYMESAIHDLTWPNIWSNQNTDMDLGLGAFAYTSLSQENDPFHTPFGIHDAQKGALLAPFVPIMPSVSGVAPAPGALHQQARPSGTPEQRHACNVPGCLKTFGRPAEFRRHKETVHGKKNKFRCMVESCDYTYPRLDKVREHMRRVHKLRIQME